MSSEPEVLDAHQHIYASTLRGFATASVPDFLGKDDVRRLEAGSKYGLPAAALRDASLIRPAKYSFFPLTDEIIVAGRAISLDALDATGRQGNYLCHNLIFDRAAVDILCDSPYDLISSIRSHSLFLDNVGPHESPESILRVPIVRESANSSQFDGLGDLAEAIVSLLFSKETNFLPALIIGDSEEVLDFLAWAYGLLPPGLRWRSSFETYSFSSARGEQRIIALPSDQRFHVSYPPHSLVVELSTQEWQWKRKLKPDPLWLRVAQLETTRATHQKQALLSVIDLLERKAWAGLVAALKQSDPKTVELCFSRYKNDILKHIADDGDLRLLGALAGLLSVADIGAVAGNQKLIESAIISGPRQLKNVLAHWLAGTPSAHFMTVALGDKEFLKLYLQALDARGADQTILVFRLYELLPSNYSTDAENVLTNVVINRDLRNTAEARQKIINGLKGLPKTTDKSVQATRELLKYRLGSYEAFLKLCSDHTDVLLDNRFIVRNAMTELVAANDFVRAAQCISLLASANSSITILFNQVLRKIFEDENLSSRQRKTLARLLLEQLEQTPNSLLSEAAAISRDIDGPKSRLFKWRR